MSDRLKLPILGVFKRSIDLKELKDKAVKLAQTGQMHEMAETVDELVRKTYEHGKIVGRESALDEAASLIIELRKGKENE